MAKLFYTLDEVAQKLGKSPEEVKEMAKQGQIQEFRDREKLMFKVEQIDLLAGGDEETSDIPLTLEDSRLGGSSGVDLHDSSADSGAGGGLASGLDDSGLGDSGLGLADSRESSGVSAFDDSDHGSPSPGATADDELSLEAVGSGSGLLDLTRESDDTSLGAELLEEVYSSDDNVEIPANASGLFEAAGADSPGESVSAGVAMAPVYVDSYDGTWSGLAAGLMVASMLAMVCIAVVVFVGLLGSTAGLATMFAGNLLIWSLGLGGAALVLAVIGLVIGKATE